MRRALVLALAGFVLTGCGLFDSSEKKPLAGERIPVILGERRLEPDSRIKDLAVRLPPPEANAEWPQVGGLPDRSMHHLAVEAAPKRLWRSGIGEGSSKERRLLASPIVAKGRIFTMDTENRVAAFDAVTGNRLWRVMVVPRDAEDDAFGGGIAFEDGRVFVTTGAAEVLALSFEDGKILWRQNVSAPIRSAPTIANGRLFTVSVDNQLHVLDIRDGNKLWAHTGITEVASLLGGSSPAVDQGVVVAPFSSGELIALRVESGRQVWADTLTSVRRADAVSQLADIRALPVMDRGRVFAISNSGRMASIDLRSGARVWDIPLASVQTPWVAGEFLFVLTVNNEIACISRVDGRIRWVQQLPLWQDEKKQRDRIFWVGPVLASDRLVIAGSDGKLLSLSPYDGTPIGQVDAGAPVRLPPIVAGKTIYVLTEDAELIAFR
jgi:outer membrane protein assembly factor BamB